ncbi:iron-sulfur cluster assembly scaffold protein [Legionella sp.]|uniref:iron-sulfur cluster assembly scaffold protein n=1 Tax=Legionella sp. TaxID=459 RepID=UPI003C95AF02
MMYNNTVRDYFFLPKHAGVIDLDHELTVVFKNTQKDQGRVEFYMQCRQDRLIQKVCFKTNGNPYLIAALEWLCRQLEGQFIDKIQPIDYQLLIKELGIPRTHYPLALRVVTIFKEIFVLMHKRLSHKDTNPIYRGINYEHNNTTCTE